MHPNCYQLFHMFFLCVFGSITKLAIKGVHLSLRILVSCSTLDFWLTLPGYLLVINTVNDGFLIWGIRRASLSARILWKRITLSQPNAVTRCVTAVVVIPWQGRLKFKMKNKLLLINCIQLCLNT